MINKILAMLSLETAAADDLKSIVLALVESFVIKSTTQITAKECKKKCDNYRILQSSNIPLFIVEFICSFPSLPFLCSPVFFSL